MKYSNYFNEKLVIVTGAGQGLGKALCLELAKHKAIVVCTDKSLQLAKHTVDLINSEVDKNTAKAIELDVADVNQITDVFNKVKSEFGKIDYLFNNAGIAIGGEIRDLDIGDWKKVMDVNLFGLITCSTEALKHMSKSKQGHIVNISSISGLLEYTALSSPYAVSKHGAVTFSKALELEAFDFNVKVTIVCPGAIKTMIGENMKYVNANKDIGQKTKEFIDKGISAELAARKIIKGVVRNRKTMIFPAAFKSFYFITRVFKFLERNFALKMIRDFRKNDRVGSI
ncbi:MAG: SDR family oxidoreductase [Bacteroidales bacterium]|nr:SDR family oxidoreductase [Bacteroidales bacterium]